MNKIYTVQIATGESIEVGSKKTAVKKGDASGESYKVLSPTGTVVHEVEVETETPEPSPGDQVVKQVKGIEKTPEPTVKDVALKHTISRTLPGNYSIVTAPGLVALGEAAGVHAVQVRFAGKLERRVDFSANNKSVLEKAGQAADEAITKAFTDLKTFQKENIEQRRGLTDMQKFIQHREVLADSLAKSAAVLKGKS